MTRRIVWSLVAAAIVATLAAAWFVHNFEPVPSERREGAQKEARRNPYLGLERLLGRLGRPVTRLASPSALDRLPAGGILIVDRHRRRSVDPARAERLLAWVGRGGYLIVAAEPVGDDPLLARLGLRPFRAAPARPADDDDEDDGAGQDNPPPAKSPPLPRVIEVRLPSDDTGYRLGRSGPGLRAAQPVPAWRAGVAAERSTLVHYAWGDGQITVVDGLDFLTNDQLGRHDHAELLWALTQRYQPQGEIRLAARLAMPTLWQWLAESAAPLLVSAAVLIGLWLWRIVPRFGGSIGTPTVDRRELRQHLAAIGRSVWREGGIGHWLTVVRQAVHTRLGLRHPHLAGLDAAAQSVALAKRVGGAATDLEAALGTEPTRRPEEFTAAMQTLQRLDQGL